MAKTHDEIFQRCVHIMETRCDFDEVKELARFLPRHIARKVLGNAAELLDLTEQDHVDDWINAILVSAWDAANNNEAFVLGELLHRLAALFWLSGEGDIHSWLFESECQFKDRLAAVSDAVGFDWQSHDSGVWYFPATGEVRGVPDYIPPIKVEVFV